MSSVSCDYSHSAAVADDVDEDREWTASCVYIILYFVIVYNLSKVTNPSVSAITCREMSITSPS
jgi:hypothetical protein